MFVPLRVRAERVHRLVSVSSLGLIIVAKNAKLPTSSACFSQPHYLRTGSALGASSWRLHCEQFQKVGRPLTQKSCIEGGQRRKVSIEALPAIFTNGLTSVVVGLAKLYSVILAITFVFQRNLIFLPGALAVDPTLQGGSPDVIVLPTTRSAEQSRNVAVYFRPIVKDGQILVFFHGNADQLGYGPAYLGNYFRTHHGLGFYGIEYPGYGLARPGFSSENTIYLAAEEMLLHLKENLCVPNSRIVLLGQSIGCGVAVEMACRGHGSQLALLSPFTSVPDMACSMYPFLLPALKLMPWMVLDRFDNASKATGLALPTLVVHGLDDDIVPSNHGRQLAGLIKGARLLLVPRMGHNDVLDREDVLKEVALFTIGHRTNI